jgi:hypothetical protein
VLGLLLVKTHPVVPLKVKTHEFDVNVLTVLLIVNAEDAPLSVTPFPRLTDVLVLSPEKVPSAASVIVYPEIDHTSVYVGATVTDLIDIFDPVAALATLVLSNTKITLDVNPPGLAGFHV